MHNSFNTLPQELQLNVFHFLLPDDPEQKEQPDLGHLRLTCKSVYPSATEVFFERFHLLLWQKNNAYVEFKSFQLLRDNPKYAALVRSVWVGLAAANDVWLRKEAALGLWDDPCVEELAELAYKATDMYPWHDWDDGRESYQELRVERDFTSKQYQATRRYHALFLDRLYFASRYNYEYQPALLTHMLRTALATELLIFPEVREVHIMRPPIKQTPHYKESACSSGRQMISENGPNSSANLAIRIAFRTIRKLLL